MAKAEGPPLPGTGSTSYKRCCAVEQPGKSASKNGASRHRINSRVWPSGQAAAFQAAHVGSIPTARSNLQILQIALAVGSNVQKGTFVYIRVHAVLPSPRSAGSAHKHPSTERERTTTGCYVRRKQGSLEASFVMMFIIVCDAQFCNISLFPILRTLCVYRASAGHGARRDRRRGRCPPPSTWNCWPKHRS